MLLLAGELEGFAQFLTVIILLILVLAITFGVTRWIGKYQKVQMAAHNMAVVDTMRLSPSQYIQIVRIGDKYLAIAVSKDNVTKLAEFEEGELNLDTAGSSSMDFSSILNRVKEGFAAPKDTDETLHDQDIDKDN